MAARVVVCRAKCLALNHQPMPTSDEMLAAPAADQRNPRRRDAGPTPVQVGALVTPDERHEWERIILPEAVRASIDVALHRFALRDDLERVWNLSRIEPNAGKCVLNFYGRPGTGKTLTALGIARRLGRPLLQVDYSAVISKYLGDTAKHIVKCFQTAAEAGAVLFFDEADSLVSRRVPADESCSTSI
ncbi:MAG: AAA family ATPase, partial [Verrucomicrobiota bacterium]